MSHKHDCQLERVKKIFFCVVKGSATFFLFFSFTLLCRCVNITAGKQQQVHSIKPFSFSAQNNVFDKSGRNSWFLWSKLWGFFAPAFLFAESRDKASHFGWKPQRVRRTQQRVTARTSRLCSIVSNQNSVSCQVYSMNLFLTHQVIIWQNCVFCRSWCIHDSKRRWKPIWFISSQCTSLAHSPGLNLVTWNFSENFIIQSGANWPQDSTVMQQKTVWSGETKDWNSAGRSCVSVVSVWALNTKQFHCLKILASQSVNCRCLFHCLNSTSFAFALNHTSRKCSLVYDTHDQTTVISANNDFHIYAKHSGRNDIEHSGSRHRQHFVLFSLLLCLSAACANGVYQRPWPYGAYLRWGEPYYHNNFDALYECMLVSSDATFAVGKVSENAEVVNQIQWGNSCLVWCLLVVVW